jgi:hypothetical protein
MPAPLFRPRHNDAQRELFDRILERVHHDVPDAVALAVSVHSKREGMTVLATRGIGSGYLDAQAGGLGGPLMVAVDHQVPVVSLDVWSDDRWPALTLESVQSRSPAEEDLARVRGAVAVPGVWQADETVVLSCLLSIPANAATVTSLIGYEQLITAALVTSAAEGTDGIADMLAVLQSRGAIEQAKGAIMGCLGCDAEAAWATLRQASHESNVKLRVLAVALVEHIGGAPAEQPGSGAPISPDERARTAARLLWAVLTRAPRNPPAGD